MFTADNTQGFSKHEIDMLNRVQSRIAADAWGIKDYSISDAIHNAWVDGISEDELYNEASRSLGLR